VKDGKVLVPLAKCAMLMKKREGKSALSKKGKLGNPTSNPQRIGEKKKRKMGHVL